MRAIDTTVGKLKIGAPLVMGKYGVNNDAPYPILWLKGTPNGDFITKDAVDFLPFDGQERENTEHTNFRYSGNPDYSLSNLLQFLNSTDECWYSPMHGADTPPDRGNVDWGYMQYERHFGFLYHFEEYEVAALASDTRIVCDARVTTLIRLPSIADILGENRFKLFNKKGVRPNGTEDMVYGRAQAGFDDTSYIPFWVSDRGRHHDYAAFISRSGVVDQSYPKYGSGVRPVCTIPLDTQVIQMDDGFYYIKPFAVKSTAFTDKELFALLGMAQP